MRIINTKSATLTQAKIFAKKKQTFQKKLVKKRPKYTLLFPKKKNFFFLNNLDGGNFRNFRNRRGSFLEFGGGNSPCIGKKKKH